jgi:predicted aspartyl protease
MMVKLANGAILKYRLINIKQLIIGGRAIYNVQVTVGTNNSASLQGIDILTRFGKFSIDIPHNQLILG